MGRPWKRLAVLLPLLPPVAALVVAAFALPRLLDSRRRNHAVASDDDGDHDGDHHHHHRRTFGKRYRAIRTSGSATGTATTALLRLCEYYGDGRQLHCSTVIVLYRRHLQDHYYYYCYDFSCC